MIFLLINHPRKVLSLLFSITIFFAYYAFFSSDRLVVDFSLEQMFPENDIEREKYEVFKDEFSREDDKFLLIYKNEDPLSRKNISILGDITDDLEWIDGIENILSLSNIEDGFLFEDDLSDSAWSSNRDFVLNHPIYTNLVISGDGKSGAIYVDLEDDVNDQASREKVFNAVDDVTSYHQGWEWYEAGVPVLRTRYVELVTKERMIFIPLAGLVVVLILFFIFRQVNCVVLPLLSISITLVWVSALMAFCGISINLISYLTYILLLIIGCSNCIHILMKYHECISIEDITIKESIQRVIKELGGALFLTSFTTAVGFFSLVMTNIRITKEFGFALGIGVILMFIIAIITIPIILLYLPKPNKTHTDRLIKDSESFSVDRIDTATKKYPYVIILLSVIFFILSAIGMQRIDYNISILDDLRPGNSLYDDIKYVDENFGGILPLEIVISSPDSNILSIDFLKKAEVFEQRLRSLDEIKKSISLVDHLKVINNALNPEQGMIIPLSDEEIEDYLYDYDNASSLYKDDGSKYRISCRVGNIKSKVAEELQLNIQNEFSKIFDKEEVLITGSTLLSLRTGRFLVRDLTNSFMLAFGIIFVSMIILFKSFRLSFIAILPNVIPLMAAAAVMGFSGIKLRPSTAMTFSIALGIAVDDTIHFLARFKQELKKSNVTSVAVSNAILSTGRPIIGTTLVLSMGFFVLYFSEFVPNHEFGILGTIILVVALLASLFLLPVLLDLFYRKKR
jgi:predicted RND superfamily exporter protein